ncbi:hypothetical protein GGR55DRAFT_697869, partial [Xylaria sp. FL0064]
NSSVACLGRTVDYCSLRNDELFPSCRNHRLSNNEASILFKGSTLAVAKSNAAFQGMKMGRSEEVILLQHEALALELEAYPESSVRVATTHNGLGEALLRAGRLAEADEVFHKALLVRERGCPDLDTAATRENIGALREARGRIAEARDMRLRGAEEGHMLCTNEHCPKEVALLRSQLKARAACQAPFYCGKECQEQDWKERHKTLCMASAREFKGEICAVNIHVMLLLGFRRNHPLSSETICIV